MKKLSIEEKAKAYEEIKHRINKAYNENRCTVGFVLEVIPNITEYKGIIDYEQKYEEALERAKPYHNDYTKDIIEDIFPELKELSSEDEKIRKRIIHALHGDVLDMEETNKAIAWLEKQGNKPQGKLALEAAKEEKVDNTNKIEAKPKFKVGDWITNGDYTWKVVEVKPLDYILQSQDGSTVDDTISYVDGQFHRYCSFCENVEIETTKIPFGAKDSELMEATYFIPKGFHAEIVDNKVIIKKGKQKPTDTYCKENCKGYQETGKCYADGSCKAKRDVEHDAQLTEEDALNRWLHFKNMYK